MNKGAKDFRRWKGCQRKRSFESAEAAREFNKGQEAYQCQHCGLWHLTGGIAKLVGKIRAPRERRPTGLK